MITKHTYISHKAKYMFLRRRALALKDLRRKYSLPRNIMIMETVYSMPGGTPIVVDNVYMLSAGDGYVLRHYPIFVDECQQERLWMYGCMSVEYNPVKVTAHTEAAVDAVIREINWIAYNDLFNSDTLPGCQISISHCDPKIVGMVIGKGKVGLRTIENAIGNGCFINYSNHGWDSEGGSFNVYADTKEYAIMAKISLEERIAGRAQWYNKKFERPLSRGVDVGTRGW